MHESTSFAQTFDTSQNGLTESDNNKFSHQFKTLIQNGSQIKNSQPTAN